MHKKFEINRKKIKGGRQSGRKVVPHNSKSDLPLGRVDGSQIIKIKAKNHSVSIAPKVKVLL